MHQFFSQYILTKTSVERLVSCVLIICLILIAREFAVFFIATFLFAYLFHEAAQRTQTKLVIFSKKCHKSLKKIVLWCADIKVLLTIIYVVFAGVFIFTIRDIVPTLTRDMIDLLSKFSEKLSIDFGIDGIQETLWKWQSLSDQVGNFLGIISPSSDTSTLFRELLRISGIFFQIIFAFILSFIWLIEYDKILKYFAQIKKSPFAFLARDIQILIDKLQKSFWLVFRAQSKIAVVNTILTVFGLIIIGIFYTPLSENNSFIYPYLLALGCITFIASFVPILGVFIGGIPIIFAGMVTYPGWSIIVSVTSMLLVIHAIEGYFLNPRIVWQSLKVPTPIVFLILFLAEHFLWIIGFFIGVPMYLLCLELFVGIGHWVEKVKKDTVK